MSTPDTWPTNHLVALLTERAARHSERLALRFVHDGSATGETLLTYGELLARAQALGQALAALAAPGERALLLYPSGPNYVLALLGCFYAGIIAVPAYPPQSMSARHLARILAIAADASPALLLTEYALSEALASAQNSNEPLARVRLVATDTLPQRGGAGWSQPIHADDLAMLQYTSGSTGTPKGVMLTHANLMANEAAIQDAFSIRAGDVIVSWLPLFHDMGLIGTLFQPLYAGVSAVLMAPQRFMERPRRWLEAISSYGGTVSGAPDFAYRLCAQRVDPAQGETLDLSSWRLAFCGAEPVRAETLEAFASRFAGSRFAASSLYPCYGLAEATLIVSGGKRSGGVRSRVFSTEALREDRALPAESGQVLVSSGVPRARQRVVIADIETGEVLPEAAIGEIQISGPSVARGYWNNAEATAATFIRRDDGVYLRTGDLGTLLDGELFVAGRQKDMIIVRGQNLYPQDIERTIERENTVVRSGRVIAFSLEHEGREGIAVAAEVNQRLLKLIEPANVCRELSELIARDFGEPPLLILLLRAGAVPLTSSGKLQRAACRRGWLEGQLAIITADGPAAAGWSAPAAEPLETSTSP